MLLLTSLATSAIPFFPINGVHSPGSLTWTILNFEITIMLLFWCRVLLLKLVGFWYKLLDMFRMFILLGSFLFQLFLFYLDLHGLLSSIAFYFKRNIKALKAMILLQVPKQSLYTYILYNKIMIAQSYGLNAKLYEYERNNNMQTEESVTLILWAVIWSRSGLNFLRHDWHCAIFGGQLSLICNSSKEAIRHLLRQNDRSSDFISNRVEKYY